MRQIAIIAHNLRSSHNVGSLLRTADGMGLDCVFLTGYTPYPSGSQDSRLPHISRKVHAQIAKTALGAENSQRWAYSENVTDVIAHLRRSGYVIAALEQAPGSNLLNRYKVPEKIAVILGRETYGIEPEVLAQTDIALEIPMFGKKESFNVVQAAAMAMFYCRFS